MTVQTARHKRVPAQMGKILDRKFDSLQQISKFSTIVHRAEIGSNNPLNVQDQQQKVFILVICTLHAAVVVEDSNMPRANNFGDGFQARE